MDIDRLINALEGGLLHYKLLLVSAPAGYGKTTLLSQWAHASRFPVAWLSIGEDDNDLDRFLRYLLAAWEQVQPGVSESPLGLLLGAMSPDRQAVLPAFINLANDAPGPLGFVLDDYHLIEDQSIHQALTFLLDHLPENLHFVLAGRGEPPLPLSRYRARDEMLEFHAGDLRFLPEETQDFLSERMALDLDPEEIEPLQARLEGWVAGLQLAALTLRRRPPGTEQPFVSGRQRFIADYLGEDVLAHLPDDLQRFLLQTSLLDRLCASLSEAVTGVENGQHMLETLEREDLFLVPLDDERQWFRYHRLFADFLREQLQQRYPQDLVGLHRRAARWYLDHELPEQAFRHALDGDDSDLVLRIFERYVQEMLIGGEFRLLKRWLDALPPAWYAQYSVISFVQTGFLLFTGQLEACIRSVEQVEKRLESANGEDTHPQLAQVSAIRCSIACFQNDLSQAETSAEQAIRDLPAEDRFFRSILYISLGDTYRRNGRWAQAKDCYLSLLEILPPSEYRLQAVHAYGALADLDLRQGHLKDAAGYWRKALAAIQERQNWGHLPLPLIGWVYIRMAELLYEWNQLTEARRHLSSGLERAELGGDVRALIAGYLIAGRMKLSEGDLEAAARFLEKARPYVESAQFSHWISRFERFQLELWLAQDRLRAAVDWSDRMLQADTLEQRPESELAQLAVARVLVVKGDELSLKQAMVLLEPLLAMAEAEGRASITIEALALQALAYSRRGATARAMSSLERALRLAEPQGYVRRFADPGLPMARLLQEARARGVMPTYVDTLLAAFNADLAAPAPGAQALPEPLTGREEQILGLLAAGLTNREIAEELVISPETVKKHAGSIYGKLGVGNRTQAVARDRELDLLA
ncbi:MAG: LuxR C-terminal-related transcriptional regulator [Anaerolineales bacterium]